jgi:hypothetical protein
MSITVTDTRALRRLAERIESVPKQVDNGQLPAGSPMYFYCRLCGHQSDVLPETYISTPRRHCAACSELKKANPGLTDQTLIEEAAKQVASETTPASGA